MKAAVLLFSLLLFFNEYSESSSVAAATKEVYQNGCDGGDGRTIIRITKRSSSSSNEAVVFTKNDLKIEKPGFFQIKLNHQELRFQICANKCRGRVTACYKSGEYSPAVNVPAVCKEANQCGFDMQIGLQNIRFMNGKLISKQRVSKFSNGCSTVLMQYQKTRIFDEIIDTCRPEVQPGYILMLNVINASPQCPLIIKNAQLDYSEIPAFAPPVAPTWYEKVKKDLASRGPYGFPQWFWVIVIVVAGVLLILSILLIALCIYVKCFYKKKTPFQIKHYETPKLLAPTKDTVEEVEKTNEVVETAHVQINPSIEQPDPSIVLSSSTSNVPSNLPPSSTQLPPNVSNIFKEFKEPKLPPRSVLLPPPTIAPSITTSTTVATINGLSQKSSQKTDSLPESSVYFNKKLLVEPHYASLLRHHCLGKNNSAKAREMRRRYPRNIGRLLQFREIKLFTLTVTEMFTEVNKMCRDAENDLKSHGITFDDKKGITKMTENGRKFIENSKTPDFIAYFAFGAEYFEYVNSDNSQLSKFSIPLLFTISMMPRIEELNRRKALSFIRSQLPKIREQYSAAEREIMAFPINAIEKAAEISQKGGENLDKLMLMSRKLMEDKTQRDNQEAAETRVAERIGKRKRRNNYFGKKLRNLI